VTGCDFTYGHYDEALRVALGRYSFVAFGETPDASRSCILLRHDVDFSLELALSMARLEAEQGVRSTFFILPHGHYNPLGAPGLGILREIIGLGHWLGLHFDLCFYAENGLPPSETIQREAATLEDRLGARLAVVAEHQPGRVPRPVDLDLRPRLDAYSPGFTRDTEYMSDSCQFWRDGCFCGSLDPARHPCLQVLVHPVW